MPSHLSWSTSLWNDSSPSCQTSLAVWYLVLLDLLGSLPTAYMCDVLHWFLIYPNGYHRPSASLLWFHIAFLAVLHLTCVTSASASDVAARQILRSATEGELLIPRAYLAIMHRSVHSLRNNSLQQIIPAQIPKVS